MQKQNCSSCRGGSSSATGGLATHAGFQAAPLLPASLKRSARPAAGPPGEWFLRGRHVIKSTAIGDHSRAGIVEDVGRARIAVARLAHGTGVDQVAAFGIDFILWRLLRADVAGMVSTREWFQMKPPCTCVCPKRPAGSRGSRSLPGFASGYDVLVLIERRAVQTWKPSAKPALWEGRGYTRYSQASGSAASRAPRRAPRG